MVSYTLGTLWVLILGLNLWCWKQCVEQWFEDERWYYVSIPGIEKPIKLDNFSDGDTWAFLIGVPLMGILCSILLAFAWPLSIPFLVTFVTLKIWKVHYKAKKIIKEKENELQ